MTDGVTYRWVADRHAAGDATRVLVRGCLVHPRLLWLVVAEACFAVAAFQLLDRPDSIGARWGVAFLLSTVIMAAVVASNTLRLTTATLRNSRIRLAEGMVLQSSFDDDRVTLLSPLAEQVIPYSSFANVRVRRDWVLMQQWDYGL